MKSEKLLDILAAGALGDAFGYAIEFDSWKKIKARFGPSGLVHWPVEPGRSTLIASDDMQMTIFALEGLARAIASEGRALSSHVTASECSKAFLRWLETQGSSRPRADGVTTMDALWHRRAPGLTCLSALSNIRQGVAELNDSKGCGAAMRAAPFAALAELWGMEFSWESADLQGQLTHHHADGHLSGAALAWMIASEPGDAVALARVAGEAATRAQTYGGFGTAASIWKALSLADRHLSPDELCDAIGEGWTGDEAVGVALWAALRSKNTTDAIRLGANHRGDSDSTASMAGQLAACLWGLSHQEKTTFACVDLAPALIAVHAHLVLSLENI